MKNKTYQALVLVIIIAIEIFGFNDVWKYAILKAINPSINIWFIQNILALKFISILILLIIDILLWRSLKKHDNHPLFIVYLIKGFQVKGSDMIGIFNIVFTLCSISWIGIELYQNSLNSVQNGMIYALFMLLNPLFVAVFLIPHKENKKDNHPQVLITALSIVNEKNLRESLLEMEKDEYKDKWTDAVFFNSNGKIKKTGPFIWGPWLNLDPIRKSIIEHHESLKEVYLISSLEVTTVINLLPNELKPEIFIKEYLNKYYPKNNVKVFTIQEGISGNDMNMTSIGLENLLRKLFGEGYINKDLVFNITSGTVAISGAMILKAIPGERNAEYCNQDTGEIVDVPLNIYDVKNLWDELLEKVG